MFDIWKTVCIASAGIYFNFSIGILVFWIKGGIAVSKNYLAMALLSFAYCILALYMGEPPYNELKLFYGFPLVLTAGASSYLFYLYSINSFFSWHNDKVLRLIIRGWVFLTLFGLFYFFIPLGFGLDAIYVKVPQKQPQGPFDSFSDTWEPRLIGLIHLGTLGASVLFSSIYLLVKILKYKKTETLLIIGLISTLIVNTNDILLGTRQVKGLLPLAFLGLLFESLRFYLVAHTSYLNKIHNLKDRVHDLTQSSEVGHIISMLSHDLRNVFMKLKTKSLSQEQEHNISEIVSTSEQILNFYLSRINKQNNTTSTVCETHETLKALKRLYSEQLKKNKIEVMISNKSSHLPIAQGDALVIFSNLFSNSIDALKLFKSEEKKIIISVNEDKNSTEIVFSDNGPGIPHQHQEKLFDIFYSTKNDGVGMGLNIVQEIVIKNAGTLSLVPSSMGTSFKLSFFK